MSPPPDSITDHESEIGNVRRGRPVSPPHELLAAADDLFAKADAPARITMDSIAASAGVGKATLFRAFGNRDGLLDALWALKLAPVVEAVEAEAGLVRRQSDPLERAITFLDALLRFKLGHRHLIRAREISPGLLQSPRYQWMHAVLCEAIGQAAPDASSARCVHAAHTLLAGLHIDLIEEMLTSGLTIETLTQAQADHVRAVITGLRSS
ncbi:TetR/AcrR family transcriptional regulator [Sphingomonas sp. CGMCC 1.13654]|uniref:TetR/AcrR family transcriptional regulator n=1 Tax=Sphingomonas chungangi TaxID=2683589 RepID=A0A838L3H7_9SPHN|nr:TetR/AcrR family transcriptional regulator [Sphingomonas chungangi]MBA2933951.1 TetR/AcrR family transcriptional regulator [Sphingomonas chungangi]